MKTLRNAACPCGSGQQYKKCCMGKAEQPLELAWYRLRNANDSLANELLTFYKTRFGVPALVIAAAEFLLWPEQEELDGLIEDHMRLFMPWFLFNWVYEPDDTAEKLDIPAGITIAQLYLSEKEQQIDGLKVRLIASAARKPFSFLEVTACAAGRGFTLEELFTGRPTRVMERAGSRMAQIGDILMGRIVTVDHASLLVGCSSIIIPHSWKPKMTDLRKQMKEEFSQITEETLQFYDIQIRELYLEIYDRMLQPPKLVNRPNRHKPEQLDLFGDD
ncbi:MAG: SEC-C domain-containing protein [Desulfobacteraceae bacterium]|nr:MAG: SEC-C domain-containing protein [Desulfobacteraceae bacterium]